MKVQLLNVAVLISIVSCVAPTPTADVSPHVHVLSQEELRTHMQGMADRIRVIAFIALDTSLSVEQQRVQIVPQLDRIQSIAAEIDDDDATTNYSVINKYMSSFLYDVALARQFAFREPPNLLPAQRLINSCLSCHESI